MTSEIRNPQLWQDGRLKIEWVRHHMPLLNGLENEFRQTLPFKGLNVALSVHLEAKTAYLCEVLAAGGAEMYVTGSNPLSTQDDIAAALVQAGLNQLAEGGEEEIGHGAAVVHIAGGVRNDAVELSTILAVVVLPAFQPGEELFDGGGHFADAGSLSHVGTDIDGGADGGGVTHVGDVVNGAVFVYNDIVNIKPNSENHQYNKNAYKYFLCLIHPLLLKAFPYEVLRRI